MLNDKPLLDIVKVHPLKKFRLKITFEDGVEGIVDIGKNVTFDGVFEPLKDEAFFRRVEVNPDTGTIEWPNGADLDPVVLYAQITKKTIKQAHYEDVYPQRR
ncbi:MAG: DUF2442 domain-containing protein [candidate division Zixibacteria bacterium]|nr:DUF2442 domain-containing protein [Candidatus Tariuqbacter arcticus]